MTVVEARLRAMSLELPPPPQPIANYVKAVRAGTLVFLAGHAPDRDGRPVLQGKIPTEVSIEQGNDLARLIALNLLSSLKAEIGDLDQVKRIVKLLSMINCPPDFEDHPRVSDGASDLLVALFGEQGRHARSSVGMSSLPWRIPLEIEMIVELHG